MIIELEDIAGNKRAFGHVPLPENVTLGQVFDRDDRLKNLKPAILQVSLNGQRADNWAELSPRKGDRVRIVLGPQFEALAGFAISSAFKVISALVTILSIISFVVSLFTQPKPTKQREGPRESPTYGFEGMRDTMAPGHPVPVIYGEHRVPVQILMYYVDIFSQGREQEMSLLGAVCEGDVECISGVEINGIDTTNITSISVATRLGTTSQSIISGFERIKNTFFDGREIGSASIVYTTNGGDIESVDMHVGALDGLVSVAGRGKHPERVGTNSTEYSVEYRSPGGAWTIASSPRRFAAMTFEKVYDLYTLSFPTRGAHDIRVKWLGATKTRAQYDRWRLWLQNITEYRDMAGANSSTALVGIRAAATSQLQGGRPSVTVLCRGRRVRIYDNVDSYSVCWTRNPAWCVLDYMTNSMYGMGAWITYNDVDIPSFLDFATLADSRAMTCADMGL